jgi:hypothetical protein
LGAEHSRSSTGKDQTLLVGGNALLVLDLLLHVLNRVRRVDVQRDGLAGQSLDEDLHGATAQAQHQVERGLLLDVVIGQRAPVLELLACSEGDRVRNSIARQERVSIHFIRKL